jgi:hypothetical protein
MKSSHRRPPGLEFADFQAPRQIGAATASQKFLLQVIRNSKKRTRSVFWMAAADDSFATRSLSRTITDAAKR